MASSSDPEKDSNKPQSKSDNPFIKFRQFADQQISSLLQGIVGLPSAFSRKPSENSRWEIFDEDLRRRDELQARQQELRESEARRLGRQTTSEEADMPVKKSPDWGAFSRWHENALTTNQDNDEIRDLPLYSPVTKALFAHLHQPTDGDVDWKQMDYILDPLAMTQRYTLRQDQQSSDCLKTTQYMVYNQLNGSPKLRSDYSLLPYVMFSPYSPLRLVESRALSPRSQLQDTFPYCDAFEDLIRTTQPPQIRTPFSQLFGDLRTKRRFLDGYTNLNTDAKASVNYAWIQDLHQSGLLQEREIRPLPRFFSNPFPVSIDAPREWPTLENKLMSKEAQTEQEMYDHFLRWASKSNSVTERRTEGLEAVVAATKAELEKEFKSGIFADFPRAFHESMDVERLDAILAEMKAVVAKQPRSGDFPDIPRAFNELMETKVVRDVIEQFDPEKQSQAQHKSSTNSPVEDLDKVVSEHTVTERVKQIDGSVQTYVSVWKLFADGRETTTTTSHTEEQERDDDEDPKPKVSMAEEAKVFAEKRKAEREAETQKTQKKGWFWN